MKKNSMNIAHNYELYNQLVYKPKEFLEKEIKLTAKPNRRDWMVADSKLAHDTKNEVNFNVSKKNNDLKYSLKLFIYELNSAPVFHFDSDGISHRNTGPDVKLSESQIQTPHINYYDENGCLQARRTEFIEKNEVELKKSLYFGYKYFCSETNINRNSNLPKIYIYNGLFDDLVDNFHDDIDFQLTEDEN